MKKILVAGNGPSIKDIDYRRLPKNIDILRVNHFYKEDYYYLGKNINYYIPGGATGLIEYLPLVFAKTMEGVYNIFKYYLYDSFITDYFSYLVTFEDMPIVDIDKHKSIYNYIKLYRNYYKRYNSYFYPNCGTLGIIKSIEYGYKEIYIVGIELVDGNNWEHFYKSDISKFDINAHEKYHSAKFEKDLIKFMSNLPDIKMYSVSESCGINEILELAPIQNNNPYIPIKKTREEIELSKDSLIFLDEVKNKIFKEWKKSKILFYQNNSIDDDSIKKRVKELEEEERTEEIALLRRKEKINKLVWWIPIKKFRDRLRVKLLNKLKN